MNITVMTKVDFTNRLLNYWDANNVPYQTVYIAQLHPMLSIDNIKLPKDFQGLYNNINGTLDDDHNGFLFYAPKDIITMGKKFSLEKDDELYNVLIFIDYMQASWWYGVAIKGDTYEIGIIPYKEKFKPLTNSLETFIDLYIEDSEILYDYS